MKRILILSNHSYMLWQFRRELIITLMERGHEIVIGVPFGERVDDFLALGCRMIDTPLERRGVNPFRDYRLYQQYREILLAENPDLVITYSVKPNIYAGYACRKLKFPYCTNIQGLGTAFQKPLIATLVTWMYKIALKEARIVFFENSGNQTFFLKKRIVPTVKTRVLRGAGINLEHFTLQPYPKNNPIRFLYLGRVMREKGINELFGAVKMLYDDAYDFRLDLVGFFEDEYKDQVQELVENGIAVFYGFQWDPRPYYAAADCVVLPSYHEGMSNVLLEGAATGRPIITTNIPGCREAVAIGLSGLTCRAQDTQSLYRAMKHFLDMSREDREQMGLEGRKRMETRFAKDEVVAQTLSALFP